MDKLRIDKWLWAARFYKTRSLAVDELQRGRVRVNGQDAKPSREVKAGDTIEVTLTFEKADPMTIKVPVRDDAP